MITRRSRYEATRIKCFILVLVLILFAVASWGHYWSKVKFRELRNRTASAPTQTLVMDSDQVRHRILAEELRQAEENRLIRALPLPKLKDSATAKVSLEVRAKLIDLQALAAFLSNLKAMPTLVVPTTAQGIIVYWSACLCTLSLESSHRLLKVRFKLRTERRVVEGWICEDAIEMLHNFDL